MPLLFSENYSQMKTAMPEFNVELFDKSLKRYLGALEYNFLSVWVIYCSPQTSNSNPELTL